MSRADLDARGLPLDAEARRQLLLTRIAFERMALRRDVARIKEVSTVSHLLRSAFGLRVPSSWSTAVAGATGREGWIGTALAWLRRYRLATTVLGTVFGGAAPLLRKRGRWRRITTFAVLGGAAYWFWRTTQNTARGTDRGA